MIIADVATAVVDYDDDDSFNC